MNHFHLHTQYSLLDGLSSVKEAVCRAKDMKATAIAVTDHGSISSMPELFKEAGEANIKPVIGCEFYVVDSIGESMKGVKRFHMCVWAKNWAGVCSMMTQLSLANRQFYRRPILDINQALKFQDCMVGTACSFGILSSDSYMDWAKMLFSAYKDDLYIEVMPHAVVLDDSEVDIQKTVNVRGIAIAKELGVKLLATNDSHYTLEEDAGAHQVMMATQYGKRLADYKGWPPVFFMRDMAQMYEAFMKLGYMDHSDIAKAMMETVRIADKVDIKMPVFPINLPRIYDDEERAMMDSCLAGWKNKLHGKLGDKYMTYRKRLVYELGVIKRLKFVPYFLMVQDIIRWARSQDIIVGPARGSSAGSLVCYLMDITRVDPIKHGLYFERFLNPERNDYPDIDVDIQDDRREEVIGYIVSRYGRENVCQISTHQELQIKGAFRDVARAYGIDMLKVNSVSKQLEEVEDFDKVPELASFAAANPNVVKYAKRLNGVIRGAGKHACGVVISSKPIESVSAVEKRNDSMVTCWDKTQCEKFGLIKMDVLGLTTLSIIDMAKKLIEKNYGKTIVLEDIPLDDRKVIEAFSRGEGNCVFQFESHGMQELLKNLNVSGFDTLVACTALYRPGPLGAGLTERYAKVSRGDEYPRYAIPQLEPILASTNSVLVYQEQIMRVCNELGGFTWSEADKMRKIIGKKLGADAFEEHRDHFVNGCSRNGIAREAASDLFSDMVSFAAYSFNLSHAVAYTMISFYSMWFKIHYPAIFLASYMSCVKNDDAVIKGMNEARRLGVSIQKPEINLSTKRYLFDPDVGIVAPLTSIKGVGEKAVDEIIKARAGSAFLSMDDFQDRVYKRVVNKRVVGNLIAAGAFSNLGVVEKDVEKREKSEAELMPTFCSIPSMLLKRDEPINSDILGSSVVDMNSMYGDGVLTPVIGKDSVIMVVNAQMKGEKRLAGKAMTNYIFSRLEEVGIKRSFVTYTSPIKANLFANPKSATTKDKIFGLSMLEKEIEAIKPKLIYCCTADAWSFFSPGEKISSSYGVIKYSKKLGTFVMAGPSPQYATCRPEDAKGAFDDCIGKIGEIFGGKNEM